MIRRNSVFNSKSYCEMEKIREDIETNLKVVKGARS